MQESLSFEAGTQTWQGERTYGAELSDFSNHEVISSIQGFEDLFLSFQRHWPENQNHPPEEKIQLSFQSTISAHRTLDLVNAPIKTNSPEASGSHLSTLFHAHMLTTWAMGADLLVEHILAL